MTNDSESSELLPEALQGSNSEDISHRDFHSGLHLKRHTHYWLANALNSAADAIVIVNQRGTVQFLNPAAERLTGWPLPQVYGHHFSKILTFEHAGFPLTDDLLRLAALNEEPLGLGPELSLVTKEGKWIQIEAEISASPPAAGHSWTAVFTLRDVTLRKWEDHQKLQEQAIRAVERLAESTTHALNNQLTAILVNSELLLSSQDLTSDQREMIAAMESGAANVAEVVRQLSAISRRKFVTRTQLDLSDVVRRLIPAFTATLPEGIRVTTQLSPETGTVHADPSQIELILYALLHNAEHSFQGKSQGEISVKVYTTVIDAPERLRSSRNFIVVKVSDNGSGMAQDTVDRVFEPFFTTKKASGHIGLGLSIAQGIIRDYHGFIEVKSALDMGSEVTFGIPAIREDAFAYLDQSEKNDSTVKTVLVVEDDHAIRHLLRKILEKSGFQAVEARDGEDAIMVAELRDGRIDVLVTDISMPGMSGPELVRQFAEMHPESKFLIISGFSAERMGSAVDLPRGVDFLQKPFKQRDFLARIEALLTNEV